MADTTAERRNGPIVAYLAFLGIVMAVGVDIALPAFDNLSAAFNLGDTGPGVSLVGTTYLLGMATGQLVFGPASDHFGRITCLKFGITLAIIGALGSAFAPSFPALLVARTVWGLGAASPAVLRTAIARDLFEGDEMARTITTITAVFLLGPIFMPSIGQLALNMGSWRTVFITATVVAVAGLAWTSRFEESLDPANRRDLRLAPLLEAVSAVARTRPTVGYIAAQTFSTGAFFIFLGSSQPVMDKIYDRGSRFAVYFGVAGTIMAIGLLTNNRLIGRFGARTVSLRVGVAVVALASSGLVMALLTDGHPPFLLWFGWVALTNTSVSLMTPMCNAMALQPMGKLAGTASAILGFVTMAGGALLASIFDALISTSVTPMAVGYTLFGSLSFGSLLWARRVSTA